MSPPHRIARAYLAKALYSPFGLAWLRARDVDTAPTAYRNAQWPTPRLLISALRGIQRLYPPRRHPTDAISLSSIAPRTFYSASAKADAHKQAVVQSNTGPVIFVSGRVNAAGLGPLMLAMSRVQADWPQVAWQLDIDADPAWLRNVLLLSASSPKEFGLVPHIKLSPPLNNQDVDAFVERALSTREPSS